MAKEIITSKKLAKFQKEGLLPDNFIPHLPYVEGHKLTPLEWTSFQVYTQCNSIAQTLRTLESMGMKVSLDKLYKWKRTEWWQQLLDAHVEFLQENLYVGLFNESHHLLKALTDIWKGKWENDKQANAVVASFREVARLGKGVVDPLTQNKKEFNLKITKEEKIDINVVHKYLPLMTDEETRDFGKTGQIPQRLLIEHAVEIEADSMDVDYKDIPVEEMEK